ncbi:sugar ABC transporter permease [Desulfurococcaceae archaeon MEX13E-LK6-19]|nr:sugar ABC transporter permease [Desulfurococcaceae archaeon MEX13E-LK6-19]
MREIKHALFFMSPGLIMIAIFVITPIIGTLYISFVTDNGIGLDNYAAVISESSPDKALIKLEDMPRPPPWGALIHNFVWIAIHLPLTTFLGLILAYMLKMVYGRSIVKSIMFIGMVIPMVIGGLIIRFMFDKYIGIVPRLFGFLGITMLDKTWTSYPDTALLSLILGSIWLWTGFSLTIHAAAIDSLPQSYIEAAKIDGASTWQIFYKVVAPSVRSATLTVVVMTMLWDLKIFDIVYAATKGGPGGSSTVLALVMWLYFARALDYGRAAATAIILTLLTLVPATIFIKRVVKRSA